MLLAAGIELPRHLYIHGYLLLDGEKMSKSLGNVLDPFEVMDKFGTDALRYYCFREVSFGQDGSVSTAGFESRYETELANDYGNLASRTLAMISRYREGVVPDVEPDAALTAEFDALPDEVCALLDHAELTQALDRIWQRVRRLNRYVEEQAPWKLAKDPDEAERLDTVLRSLADGLRAVTVLLHAYMPETTERLMDALGQDGTAFELSGARLGAAPGGATVKLLDPPLFPKQQA
jgi:methionyl-tRNA synthetase